MITENYMNCLQSIRAGVGVLKSIAVLALITTVAACTAGGAPTTTTQATTPGAAASSYNGPAASTADVQSFKISLWENIRTSDKCGGCHHENGQSPMFARSDDVNQAYQAATALVNFQQPDQSTLVLRVGSGHNCWVADPKACADTMLTWIKAWIGTSATSSTGIVLTPPTSTPVAGGKLFPASATDSSPSFATTVYPLLKDFCSGCHQPSASSAQTPYFASSDVNAAYAAAQSKIDLNTPANSRFVVRLRDEHHNCWTTTTGPTAGPSDCVGSSTAMLNAIQAYAAGIAVTQVDTAQVLSQALHLKDGTIASGGNRSEANIIAKYEFKTGKDHTAFDTSGVSPSADLLLQGDVTWAGGWGIGINKGGKAQATTAASSKIAAAVTATGEYSIEAWVAPANVAQTDAWIVSYSGSDTTRNVTLGQHAMQYQAATRSDQTDPNGKPPLLTAAANMNAQAALQHVVLTYDPVNGQQLYVNGVFTGDKDPKKGGSLASWDNTFALVLGSETTGKEQWLGVIKFLAIHSRALTAAQVMQNFNAGVGEKYFLLFDVSSLSGVPQSYIKVTASVLDSYGYQFSSPTFISLDPNAAPANIPVKGIRIGVNGVELPTGQSYSTVNTTVGGSGYTAANGQLLSSVGAVVAAASPPDSGLDLFFLTFEQLGTHLHAHTEPTVPVAAPVYPTVAPPTSGVKNFAQINSTLSQITGVPVSNPTTYQLYMTLQQSLPPTNDITAFLSSHQSAIAQLTDQYCNIAVHTPSASTLPVGPLFPALDINQTDAGTYFGNAANVNMVVNALINRAIGTGVNTANATIVTNELTSAQTGLIPKLVAANPTGTGRVATIAQAACTAVLGSSVVSLQ
jgi:cytochrome c553